MTQMEPIEINELLDAAIEAARTYEGLMGTRRKGKAEKTFESLRNSSLKLSNPEAFIERLSAKRFATAGLNITPEIEQSMQAGQGYVYYLIPSPVLMHPERGAQYRLLECSFELAGEGSRALGIVRLFPEPRFKPVLQVGSSFNLAVDAGLNWGVEVKQTAVNLGKFQGDLSGRVSNENGLKGFIKVLPFEYTLGRREIEANFSNDKAIWRFDGKAALPKGNVCPALLVKVPQDAKKLTITGKAEAEVAFNWFTANIEHVFDKLPALLRRLIKDERRAPPLVAKEKWVVNLPEEIP